MPHEPRAVAFDRLHLDDFGPHVGQHHAAGRAHHHVRELDHAQAGERLRRGGGGGGAHVDDAGSAGGRCADGRQAVGDLAAQAPVRAAGGAGGDGPGLAGLRRRAGQAPRHRRARSGSTRWLGSVLSVSKSMKVTILMAAPAPYR